MDPLRLPIADSSESVPSGCSSGITLTAKEKRRALRKRLPPWFRTALPTGEAQEKFNATKMTIEGGSLNTVCEEARCPNIHDCWGRGTATFMIAGEECTRGCRFCAVGTIKTPLPLDPDEPTRLAEAVKDMALSYVVITVVNRDDLQDGGAAHYRACIDAIHEVRPDIGLEILCSDLDGNLEALSKLLDGAPLEVFAHNVECTPRLDSKVRDARASFEQSKQILQEAKRLRPDILTKTSIMVGVGETNQEISEAMEELRSIDVDLLTIGQYLQPSDSHLPIDRFPEPKQYADWDSEARRIGFKGVACGPLVRSSFRAGLLRDEAYGAPPAVTQSQTNSAISYLTPNVTN
ncbi:MAG TPA: lipoyl synthase [Candidatus Thalassarchaeaceae archaeon]|nr:lipoyl synthase [Candidatus Thalassarchaeaceae archaeon]